MIGSTEAQNQIIREKRMITEIQFENLKRYVPKNNVLIRSALDKGLDFINSNPEIETECFKIIQEQETIQFRPSLMDSVLSLIQRKKTGEATELLVNEILNNNFIYTTKTDVKQEIWVYQEGIYEPNGESHIKEIIRNIMNDGYSEWLANQVLAKVKIDTFIETNYFFNQNVIEEVPVQNGILNIFTREIQPFTPKKIFFNKLPVIYDPSKDCPLIDKFLSEVLAKKDDKKLFYELGGFCLLKEYRFEKAFMFVGSGRNGKDKSLELIKRLLGAKNCCSIPLSSIVPDSFIISEFYQKLANLAGEINNHDLKDTSAFKGLTGRSLQTAQRKYLTPITFINHAKFIFACNDLPMVSDDSVGFWDRWILLEFPYTFLSQEEIDKKEDKTNLKVRDDNIIQKITIPEEMSGLLNRFLDGLDRIISQKKFSNTQGSEEVKQLWVVKSNSVMAFCLNCIVEDYDGFIMKKDFRRRYIDYCKKYKVKPRSDYVIKRTLENLFGVSEGNKPVLNNKWEKSWEGITWKFV
jgi:P4 family phage/plasmid primase-like protien